jgi:hypothetical protein
MVVGEQEGMDRVTTNFRSGSSITSVKVISCPRAQCECDARCCHCVPMCERRLFTALGRLLGEGTALVEWCHAPTETSQAPGFSAGLRIF